jgi:hypothetical protein
MVMPIAAVCIVGLKDVQNTIGYGKNAVLVMLMARGSKLAENVLK